MSELFKQPFPDRLGSLTGLRARLRWRETDSRRAARGQSSWLRMEQLEDRLAPTVSLAQNFTGIDSAQTSGIPPDATAAVGPNTVIETVNRAITLMDKTGSTRVGPIDLSTFFSSIFTAHDFIMDPSVVYDDQAGRFYVVLEESGFVQGQLDFAVSKGSNPATLGPTDWSFYAITEVNEGGTASPGIPKIGWNDDAVFLSTNQGNTPSLHCHILAVSKLSLLAGGALSFNSTNITTNSERNILVPARMHNETTGNLEYFVQSEGDATSNTVIVVQETGYLAGSGTFTFTPLAVNSYNNSPGVSGLTVFSDDRILSVDWINNGTAEHMVATGNVGVAGVNRARWYEFNAPTSGAPTLLQQGDIDLGPAIATSFPSIAINASDTIALTFLENGNGQATSMYVTGRVPSDPLNFMQPPTLVRAGLLPASDMRNGGDYSATEYDPTTPASFWSANEFQLGATGSSTDWGTQMVAYTFLAGPLVMPPSNQRVSEGASMSFTLGSFVDSSGMGTWSVTVDWGDGTANTNVGPLTVTGSLGSDPHTFAEEGTYTVVVSVTNTMTMRTGFCNFVVTVALAGSSPVSLLKKFSITGAISPDPIMGVSPTTVASVASFSIALTNRSGGGSVGPVDFFTFFSSVFVPNDFGLGGGQVLYDDQAGRFYVAAEEIDSSSTVAMDFAVSKTSSPATLGSGDWNFFHITEANEGDNLEAFTYLMGWNSDAVFLSMGMFHGEVTFDHNLILAISKASILAGGPLSTQATDVFTGADDQTLVPARMHSEAGGNLEYFVQSQGSSTSTTVNVVQDTGYLAGSGTFLTTPLTVNSYDNSPGVAGLTGKADNRILSVDWVNNGSTQHMVACGNIGAGGVNLARWYEFNAPTTGTPTLLQQGDINVGSAIATSFPSIAINPADSIAMTFLEDGYGQATSMYVTGRQATDPPNTMQDPILVQSGVLPVPDAVYGYGNYSGTEYDPANSANFWSINQFHSGATGQSFFGGIEIAEFTLLPASAPSPPTLMSPANQMVNEGTLIGLSPGFTDTSYGSWKVTIAWGDGSPNTTLNPTAPGLLGNQTHTYAEEGSYTVTITVLNATTNLSSSAMAQVTVNEVNIVPMSATLSPIAGAPFSGRVANFTDPGGAEANDGTHYSASIDWGDHTATTGGVIGFAFNSFRILGAHTFAAAGSYTLTITITHEGTTTTVQESVGVATLGQFVSAGLTMPLGFWEGLQGQQLIRRFGATNSGQTLGQWLATTYPNLYGASNGAPNLSLFTDGQIGSYFQSLFLVSKGTGLDAEVLATALEIFATTESLGGTTAQTHGFTVTSNGLGAYSWNIGPSGQAFDVPNNTTLDVYQILMGANNFAVGGEPWDSDSFLRNQAYAVFRAINGG